MNKYHRVMEVFWTVIAIASAIYGGFYFLRNPYSDDALPFIILPIMAGFLAFFRRRMRISAANKANKEDN